MEDIKSNVFNLSTNKNIKYDYLIGAGEKVIFGINYVEFKDLKNQYK